MNKLVEEKLNDLHLLCEKYMVDSMFLFGSANTDRFNENSDLDFMLSFSKSLPVLDYAEYYFELEESLIKLFNRKIDLVVEKSVKNPYFKEEIDDTKVKVYGA